MAYDTEKAKAGRQPFGWVELVLEGCSLAFGQTTAEGTCPASGEPCFNSWATCKAPDAYTATDKSIRLCTPVERLPLAENFIPFLEDVRVRPGETDPGNSLGRRIEIRVSLLDAPHDDVGIDPYVTERSYDPLQRGTFWPRLRARFPYYVGRTLNWYSGFLTQPFDEANFQKRTYIIESIEGPGSSGEVTIVAKDPLKLADNDRAQCPRASQGELALAIGEADSITTIDILTPDPTEYDLKTGETEDYVCIGDEVFTYTGTTPITDGVRLTGVTRSAPDTYETEQQSHDAEDTVQRCRYLKGRPIDVFRELLTQYADIPAAYIPFADWEEEADTWLGGFEVRRLVTEPEGVLDLLDELIEQSLTWGLWWDEIAQEIKYRAIRPADVDEVVAELTDADHLVADSVDIKDEPDRQVNEVRILYAPRNPTEDDDEVSNYRRGVVEADLDSQSGREVGQRRIKTIYGRWHPGANAGQVAQIARRTLNSRVRNLRRVEFQVDRKDDSIKTAQFCDLETMWLMDAFGVPVSTRVQVLRIATEGDTARFVAREDFFGGTYARIAPGDLGGLTYADASQDQRERYIFIADSNGEMSGGDDGYQLL